MRQKKCSQCGANYNVNSSYCYYCREEPDSNQNITSTHIIILICTFCTIFLLLYFVSLSNLKENYNDNSNDINNYSTYSPEYSYHNSDYINEVLNHLNSSELMEVVGVSDHYEDLAFFIHKTADPFYSYNDSILYIKYKGKIAAMLFFSMDFNNETNRYHMFFTEDHFVLRTIDSDIAIEMPGLIINSYKKNHFDDSGNYSEVAFRQNLFLEDENVKMQIVFDYYDHSGKTFKIDDVFILKSVGINSIQ